MKQYYDILGLQEGASKKEIKQAYRKMAMLYHPDLNPGKESKQKFIDILEAYEYLMGIRQMNNGKGMSYEDLQKFYELMKKAAEEKAKREYREKVREFKKQKERKQAEEYQKAIYLLVAILVLAVGIWQGYKFYSNLMINGDKQVAEVEVVGIGMKRMKYAFPVGDSLYKDERYVSNNSIEMISGNGMPLRIGDRFEVEFSGVSPGYHRINFEKVSARTMQRYFAMVSSKLTYLFYEDWKHFSNDEKRVRAACITSIVFSRQGFDGLSTIYYADANVLDNFSHNSWTWYFMKTSDEFVEILEACQARARD